MRDDKTWNRLLDRTEVGPRPHHLATRCLLWQGAETNGYPVAVVDGGKQYLHRYALSLALGRPLSGHALHRCDTPACINPLHLYEGTPADNARDMVERGRRRTRAPRGENAGNAKLTVEQVKNIRERLRNATPGDGKQTKLAREFGVSLSTINRIRSGERWATYKGAAKTTPEPRHKRKRDKLTPDDVRQIRQLRTEGLSQREIAERFGVSQRTVSNVVNGRSWKQVQ